MRGNRATIVATGCVLVAVLFTSAEAGTCPPGKVKNADTNGVCCWEGQAAGPDQICVGEPDTCPDGFIVHEKKQTCVAAVCPEGMKRASKAAPCCFPGQAWNRGKGRCVGTVKKCPAGLTPRGETCENGSTADLRANLSRCDAGQERGCFDAAYAYDHAIGTWRDPARAWRYFRLSCERGNVNGCTNMGLYYQAGDGTARDMDRARTLYESGCNARDPQGCYMLGVLYLDGRGVAVDKARARQLFQSSCTMAAGPRGWRGCTLLADMTERGEGGPADPTKARAIVQATCAGNRNDHGESCDMHGAMLVEARGGPRDVPNGLVSLRKGCDAGKGYSCLDAGLYDWLGGGWVTPDPTRARRYLHKACTRVGKGCAALAFMLARGQGGPRDVAGARRLVQKSCAKSKADIACWPLAVIDLDAKPKKPQTALRRLDGFCSRDPLVCRVLAQAYVERPSAEADHERAKAAFERSCTTPELCFLAGEDLLKLTDRTRARAAFDHACRKGHSRGCERRQVLDADAARAALQTDQTQCKAGSADHCYAMAQRYFKGRGVPFSSAQARSHLTRACSLHLNQRGDAASENGKKACDEVERWRVRDANAAADRKRRAAAAAAAAEAEKVRQRRQDLAALEHSESESDYLAFIRVHQGTPEGAEANRALDRMRERVRVRAEAERQRTLALNRAARTRMLSDADDYDARASKATWAGVGWLTFDLVLIGGGIALIAAQDEFLIQLVGSGALGYGLGGLLFTKRHSKRFSEASRLRSNAREQRSRARDLQVSPIVTPRSVGLALGGAF